IKVLASDDFGGREPATPGEDKSIHYIADQFKAMGLAPGNGDSYFQEVPLVKIAASPDMQLTVDGGGESQSFSYGDQMMAWTKREVTDTGLDGSDMVFVGYGIVAPEYNWNDYADVDVKGKTVVILVNDPGFATQNDKLFNGNAMTYYGRWTYKYEEAARQGAAGAIIIHQTAPAGYPWEVVRNSWTGPQYELTSDNRHMDRAAVEGWVTHDVAESIFKQAGLDLDKLSKQAATPGFHAVHMNLKANLKLHNTELAHSTSHNVIARIKGSKRPDETVFYTAHWDHLGTDPTMKGDQIFNGAADNASGVGGLLELAQAFSKLKPAPARSVVFMATTSEEQGLLGAKYYAEHPIYPLATTVADINMDVLNIWGPTKDMTVIGYGSSELEKYLADATAKQGRTLHAEDHPEKGYYFRADHFEFAKHGVPALYTGAGTESTEHGKDWMDKQRADYTANHYHKPSDEYDPNWDLRGAVEDLKALFMVGKRLSSEDTWPNWYEGNAFRAIRDETSNVRSSNDN
ncbi:MAG: M28 family metallopeptidase, partial [Gammaproteobacteria bacterium]